MTRSDTNAATDSKEYNDSEYAIADLLLLKGSKDKSLSGDRYLAHGIINYEYLEKVEDVGNGFNKLEVYGMCSVDESIHGDTWGDYTLSLIVSDSILDSIYDTMMDSGAIYDGGYVMMGFYIKYIGHNKDELSDDCIYGMLESYEFIEYLG